MILILLTILLGCDNNENKKNDKVYNCNQKIRQKRLDEFLNK